MKIVLIIVDCMRPDHLGCYGYPKDTSPCLDRIAQQGVVFETAVAQANWTYPSIYSMITGRYPSVLKLDWLDSRVNEGFATLPEQLARAGYHTALFSNFGFLTKRNNFGSHFEERRLIYLNQDTPSQIGAWAKQHKDAFLYFHIGEYVHEPFFADRSVVGRFLDRGVDAERALRSPAVKAFTQVPDLATGNDATLREMIGKINKRIVRVSAEERSYLLSTYDAGIHTVDAMLGSIHTALRDACEDYLFIVTADHGQCFFEHNIIGHGLNLWDEVVRVPLIMDYGNRMKGRVKQSAALIDLYPTIVEAAQCDRPARLDGQSLFSLAGGVKTPSRHIYSEGYPYFSVRGDDYKLVTSYFRFLPYREVYGKLRERSILKSNLRNIDALFSSDKVFNMREDAGERVNLRWKKTGVHRDLVASARKFLFESERESLPARLVSLDEEDEIKKQLADLGYL